MYLASKVFGSHSGLLYLLSFKNIHVRLFEKRRRALEVLTLSNVMLWLSLLEICFSGAHHRPLNIFFNLYRFLKNYTSCCLLMFQLSFRRTLSQRIISLRLSLLFKRSCKIFRYSFRLDNLFFFLNWRSERLSSQFRHANKRFLSQCWSFSFKISFTCVLSKIKHLPYS